jgi:hypothetical protein
MTGREPLTVKILRPIGLCGAFSSSNRGSVGETDGEDNTLTVRVVAYTPLIYNCCREATGRQVLIRFFVGGDKAPAILHVIPNRTHIVSFSGILSLSSIQSLRCPCQYLAPE